MALIINPKNADKYQVQTVRIKRAIDKKDKIRQKPLTKMDLSRVKEENLLYLALNDVIHRICCLFESQRISEICFLKSSDKAIK